jgi:L,D-peptidoglycan transpeptidase YkuD (ErfK/YbiS/YcfS/YnhG family)
VLRLVLSTAAVLILLAPEAAANFCPRPLHRATRLVIVTVSDMTSVKATVHTFTRKTPADATWERAGLPEPAVVGAAGIGWGQTFASYAKKDEAIKREGDKKTPAGVFRLGPIFGFDTQKFDAHKIGGYVQLKPGKSFCVDDPGSMRYGQIIDKASARGIKSGEDMANIPAYKRGIVVNYPALRGAKAGSCIFVHVWEGDSVGTSGRVALPEERVAALQEWSGKGFTAIAILSENAADRFKGCLPLNSATSSSDKPAALPMPHPRRAKDQRAELTPGVTSGSGRRG